MKKLQRVLNMHLYNVVKRKDILVTKTRLWRVDSTEQLKELDSKYQNYTHVQVDATVLNITDEQLAKPLHEVDISDTDIMLVELQKDKEFVFQPQNGPEETKGHEDFRDPLQDISSQSTASTEIDKLDL